MAWITPAQVAARLPTVDPADPVLIEQTAAAIDWARRERAAAGYVDDPDVSPDAAVAEGVILYAVALARQAGVVDGWASFADQPVDATGSTFPRIKHLIGIPRAAGF